FFDSVRFRPVVAVSVKAEELAARKHLAVINIYPFFPVRFLVGSQFHGLKFRSIARPRELGPNHCADPHCGCKISSFINFMLGIAKLNFGELDVTSVPRSRRPDPSS